MPHILRCWKIPNILGGVSRVDDNKTYALVDKIDWSRLDVMNNHTTIQKRKDEDERLGKLHEETLKENDITKRDWIDLMMELDDFSADGYRDAICEVSNDNCSCIACNANTDWVLEHRQRITISSTYGVTF